jgi:hypothetical protein
MVVNAGTGSFAEVDAHVEAPWGHTTSHQSYEVGNQVHHVGLRLGRQLFQAGQMLVRQYHQMTIVVRVQIQNRKDTATPEQNVVPAVALFLLRYHSTEDTRITRLVAHDILHPPGCPNVLHESPRFHFRVQVD